ncbi:permease [Psychromicrobium lacuslunae]|uniref:Permease n=1 Tax=Psychromicrobium lacuslunae TaxID=1618207 RepID=A0A0D4C3J8_9MICC|nr:permease [Psychromicrobium lacuslunae]
MRTVIRLSLLTARGGIAGSTLVLPVVAFALTTTLLLVVLAGTLSFFRWQDEYSGLYQTLAAIAVALLVVPLLALGGSAARLSARRRDDKLSTLRLLGATPATVNAMTVLESSVLALGGAVIGVLGYLLLTPLVGLIHFRGEALGASALWLSPLLIVAVVLAVVLLAIVSAAIGLRRVNISPLGVRTRQNPPKVAVLRIIIGAVFLLGVYLAMSNIGAFGSVAAIALVMLLGFGGVIAMLNLMGPAILGMLAQRQWRRAQTPVKLLASRQILESPKAAWRQVSGVAMTSFMAVFCGVGLSIVGDAESSGASGQDAFLISDTRTGVIITLVISFIMVACSIGVNQASQILDRAEILVSLDRLGAPRQVIEAARSRAVMSPLRIVSLGSALIAAVLVFPLTALSVFMNPVTILLVLACLFGGILLVWLSLKATAPVMSKTLSSAERV